MKRIFLTFFIFLYVSMFNVFSFTGHLDFVGIPIDGKGLDFTEKLVKKGFSMSDSDETHVSLYGTFAGIAGVSAYVAFKPCYDDVFKVILFFPKKDDWKSLKGEYLYLVDHLSKSYGLTSRYEYIVGPSDDEMRAVREERAVYVSYFVSSFGSVKLEIMPSGEVMATFEDEENTFKSMQR